MFFFFQAEDGIRDGHVTGVQTCALPISRVPGVGQFQLFASSRAMRIWVDPEKLVSYDISMSEVNQAISEQNILISAGILGSPPNPESQLVAAPIVANGQLKDRSEERRVGKATR